jgi:hypothetical protein
LDEESLEDHSLVGIYQSLGNSMSFIRFWREFHELLDLLV